MWTGNAIKLSRRPKLLHGRWPIRKEKALLSKNARVHKAICNVRGQIKMERFRRYECDEGKQHEKLYFECAELCSMLSACFHVHQAALRRNMETEVMPQSLDECSAARILLADSHCG